MGTFSCAQIDLRKTQERELATLDGKSTSSGITAVSFTAVSFTAVSFTAVSFIIIPWELA